MAQARLSVRKIREVLRLKAEARLSDREIAEAIGSVRSTVQECLRRAKAAGDFCFRPSATKTRSLRGSTRRRRSRRATPHPISSRSTPSSPARA